MPYNESSSLALDAVNSALWIGTSHGVARWDMAANTWRYYYLQRYLPGHSQVSSVAVYGNCTIVATDGGIAILEAQQWTLAKKAEHYEAIQARHNRWGGWPSQ